MKTGATRPMVLSVSREGWGKSRMATSQNMSGAGGGRGSQRHIFKSQEQNQKNLTRDGCGKPQIAASQSMLGAKGDRGSQRHVSKDQEQKESTLSVEPRTLAEGSQIDAKSGSLDTTLQSLSLHV